MAKYFARMRGKALRPGLRVWTDKEQKLIGTLPDRKVAEIIGRTTWAVRARRNLLKIPYLGIVRKSWNAKQDRLLGKISDEEAARRTGRTSSAVAIRRRKLGALFRRRSSWTPDQDRLLGTKTDIALSQILKIHRSVIRRRRLQLKIPPFEERTAFRPWSASEDSLLGTAPDPQLAKVLGRTRASVQMRRLQLHLPSFREQTLAGRSAR